jgi:hypothetical protein
MAKEFLGRGFSAQKLSPAKTYAGLHVNCLFVILSYSKFVCDEKYSKSSPYKA